jgi:hypothetical protein
MKVTDTLGKINVKSYKIANLTKQVVSIIVPCPKFHGRKVVFKLQDWINCQ